MGSPKAGEVALVIILALASAILGIFSSVLAWADGESLGEAIRKGSMAFGGWLTLGIVVAVSLGLLQLRPKSHRRKANAMIYVVAIAAGVSICVGLFGFFIGRCSRKLPIMDDNLPWMIHRGQGTSEPIV